jgi:hypothetical protein
VPARSRSAARLDRAVKRFDRLAELSPEEPRDAEDRDHDRELVTAAGRAADPQDALGVCVRLGEPVQVELGARDEGDGIEPPRGFGVGERVDRRGGLGVRGAASGVAPRTVSPRARTASAAARSGRSSSSAAAASARVPQSRISA